MHEFFIREKNFIIWGIIRAYINLRFTLVYTYRLQLGLVTEEPRLSVKTVDTDSGGFITFMLTILLADSYTAWTRLAIRVRLLEYQQRRPMVFRDRSNPLETVFGYWSSASPNSLSLSLFPLCVCVFREALQGGALWKLQEVCIFILRNFMIR